MSTRRGYLLAAPIFGRVRTHADKHKPHSFSFECGVLVAAERNASYGCFRRQPLADAYLPTPLIQNKL